MKKIIWLFLILGIVASAWLVKDRFFQNHAVSQTLSLSPQAAIENSPADKAIALPDAATPVDEKMTKKNNDCDINGAPCWEVIRIVFDKTQAIDPSDEIKRTVEKWWEQIEYKNEPLEELGLFITNRFQYKDGGSQTYILSNDIHLHQNWALGSPNIGEVTLTWPDKSTIVFDKRGKIIATTSSPKETPSAE